MTVREVEINRPFYWPEDTPAPKVRFTDYLGVEDFEAICSNSPPYLFFGVFAGEDGIDCFYGDARSHADLRSAVEEERGKISDKVWGWGQIHVENQKLGFVFLKNPPFFVLEEDEQEVIMKIMQGIEPSLFVKDSIGIGTQGYGSFSYSRVSGMLE